MLRHFRLGMCQNRTVRELIIHSTISHAMLFSWIYLALLCARISCRQVSSMLLLGGHYCVFFLSSAILQLFWMLENTSPPYAEASNSKTPSHLIALYNRHFFCNVLNSYLLYYLITSPSYQSWGVTFQTFYPKTLVLASGCLKVSIFWSYTWGRWSWYNWLAIFFTHFSTLDSNSSSC